MIPPESGRSRKRAPGSSTLNALWTDSSRRAARAKDAGRVVDSACKTPRCDLLRQLCGHRLNPPSR